MSHIPAADKDKLQQSKASVRNQLDKLLESIDSSEKLTIAHPRPNPLDDTTLKNDVFNLDESIMFEGNGDQIHNQSMHAMMSQHQRNGGLVEDNELTGRNEQHHIDPSVMPLSNPDPSHQSSGPFIRQSDSNTTGVTSVKTFMKYKSSQRQKTKKIKSNIKKLKNELVQRALVCSSLGKLVDKNEYTTEFNLPRFLKFFIYHLVFFGFGPLTLILIRYIDSMGLAHNMGFTLSSKIVASTYFQYLFWLNDVYLAVMWGLYYLRPDENWLSGIYQEQVYFFILHQIIRSFIVSVRYGFISDLRHDLYKASVQDLTFIAKDLLTENWIKLNPTGGLMEEIQASMYRNNVEEQVFTFSFTQVLDRTSAARYSQEDYYLANKSVQSQEDEMSFSKGTLKYFMAQRKDEIIEYTERYELRMLMVAIGNKDKAAGRRVGKRLTMADEFENDLYNYYTPETIDEIIENNKQRYPAKLLMREIALFGAVFQLSNKFPLIITFLRALSPFVARAYETGNPVAYFGWDSWMYQVFELFFCSVQVYFNYVFVHAGLIDFHRREKMLLACSGLIDPIKDNKCPAYRSNPTINFFDVQSLQTWYQMRQCILDLGRKYLKRIFLYSSCFLAFYLGFVIYRLLGVFKLIDSEVSNAMVLLSGVDTIFVLGNILAMLYYGASVNSLFVTDQLLLVKLKHAIVLIKKHLKLVLSKSEKDDSNILSDSGSLEDRVNFDDEYMKILAVQIMAYQRRKPEKTRADIRKKLDKLIKEVDIIRERLEIESQHHPLRIMGLKATYELMNQIYTGLATVGIAVIQQATQSSSDAQLQ
ncbi:hypothetical protein FGO68_gene934 [Halteria grandinella]|uniref:Uncharacterized protein n=1 Tax=Halteria grandinella TaxID=5974 RepID=A0A8J8NZB5_HALGN|nr:hypothetical protein FGO68_gene934 [Halteria grandinella]